MKLLSILLTLLFNVVLEAAIENIKVDLSSKFRLNR